MGKTVEQALLEVMEEEELASLRAQQVSKLSVLFCSTLPLLLHYLFPACL